MFGTKKLIQQYEARLAALEVSHAQHVAILEAAYRDRLLAVEAHLKDLRSLAVPSRTEYTDASAMEADLILSGSQETVEVELTSAERAAMEEIDSERDRILSGAY